MFVRQFFQTRNGRRHAYWALVESYRTAQGPRQRVVAWLGNLDEQGRLGLQQAADGRNRATRQPILFEEPPPPEPRWVRVDAAAVRVENCRHFGGPWLALELIRQLRLDEFLKRVMPRGEERVPWALSALVLIIARLCEPSSELYVAEQWYPKTALPELLGVPAARVDDNRLYRALDQLLPHKEALETHLKERLGELFELEYDLLLYDVTSTYFEGKADFPLAQRGYSRDQRSDCKQVCIALVVSRCGMPLGYELFAGNTTDVTTVETIVATMESRYGRSNRIWVMDRGMISEDNLEFLRQGQRRYIVGTPKPMLKEFEAELLKSDWREIQAGVEVKLCPAPDGGAEKFILCRSRDRKEKDLAIVRRFEQRIEQRLTSLAARCQRQRRDPGKVEREVGRLLGQNTRAARLFEVTVTRGGDGRAQLTWQKIAGRRDWATLSAGCYLLRSNVADWSDEELWRAYIQLTEAEAAFRIHKSDLALRPIWHQKEDRVRAHILVCFLAYVLWKTLAALCRRAGLGDEPRRVLAELSELRTVDVVLPTDEGIEIRRRCITRPSDHQAILLHHLGLNLPTNINSIEM
jgi:transposase